MKGASHGPEEELKKLPFLEFEHGRHLQQPIVSPLLPWIFASIDFSCFKWRGQLQLFPFGVAEIHKESRHSAYWTPQLYYQYRDGQFISVAGINHPVTVYYLHHDVNNPIEQFFPEGFRMIAGDTNSRASNASAPSQYNIKWTYSDDEDILGTFSYSIPNTTCKNGLRAIVVILSCWDGVNLDSPDHKSYVAYPPTNSGGLCTEPKFPVQLMRIKYKMTYDVGQFAGMWYGNSSPFVLANGDPKGYGMHADCMNDWDTDVQIAGVQVAGTILDH